MMAGFESILQQPWTFPPTVTHQINAPSAVSIVYTDSIPWLALTFKALHLGRAINPLGAFVLASYLLQAAAMAVLLWESGARRPLSLLTGSILALLFPAWIARQFGHIALAGHWILLLALALSVGSARKGLTLPRAIGFVALATVATGVHAYHLIPVAICLAAALVSELIQRGRAAWPWVLAVGGATTLAVALSALVLGYGVSAGGGSDGGGALGYYSMNVLGPIWPQASALFGQRWTGAWFTGVVDPNGGQWFEGYNYLGAGILFLIAAASAMAVLGFRRNQLSRRRLPRYLPLAVGMVLLTCVAIGPTVYFGAQSVLTLPKPTGALGDALGLFRCHGRFFWAVGYLLLAAAVAVVDRTARWREFVVISVLALGMQAFDVKELHTGVHAKFAHAAPARFPAALQTSAAVRGRPWVFTPTFYCATDPIDHEVISELSLVAIRQKGTSNSVPTARDPNTGCAMPADLGRTAANGDPRITVVVSGLETGGPFDQLRARTDCYRFLRGLMCGAGLSGVPGLDPAPADTFISRPRVTDLAIGFEGGTSHALAQGWAEPGPGGVWSQSKTARLAIPAPLFPNVQNTLEVSAMSFAKEPAISQTISVSVNGRPLDVWEVESQYYRPYTVTIPPDLMKAGKPIDVEFGIPGAASPSPQDPRLLGIGLQKLSLSH